MSDNDFFSDDYDDDEEEDQLNCQKELEKINEQEENETQQKDNNNIFEDFEVIAEQTEENKRVALLQNIQKSKQQNQQKNQQEENQQGIKHLQDQLEKYKKEIEKEKENNPHLINEEEILQKILDKKEMKKMTNKLRQNPEEYINFTKTYIILDFLKIALLYNISDTQQAQIISRLQDEDLQFLEKLIIQEKNTKDFSGILSTLMYHFKKYFIYKWKSEQNTFQENLDNPENFCFGYLQMLQIFITLCQYFKLHVKICYIQDLSLLDIDQKYGLTASNKIKDFVKKKGKKRQRKQVGSISSDFEMSEDSSDEIEVDYRKTQKSKRNQSLSAFMERKIFSRGKQKVLPVGKSKSQQLKKSKTEQEQNDDDLSDSSQDKNSKKKKQQEEDLELENMLDQFKFKKGNKKKSTNKSITTTKLTKQNNDKQQKQQENFSSETLKYSQQQQQQKMEIEQDQDKEESKKDETDNKEPKIPSFDNIDEFAANNFNYNKKQNSGHFLNNNNNNKINMAKLSDHYKEEDIKLWLEVYDEKNNKWVAIDPVQQKLLTFNSIQNKIMGIPVLFIVSLYQLDIKKQYNQNDKQKEYEQELHQEQIDHFIQNRPLNNVFFTDISGLYAENYIKLQISRRSLKLQFWWQDTLQSCLSYTGRSHYLSPIQKQALNQELTSIEKEIKRIIPSSPYQFRVSDHYVIKSEVKKYKMIKEGAQPIQGLIYKDEEVYWKKDVIELNGKTRWGRMQRKIKKGEQGIKQVASIMGGGRMVDLYTVWQTEYEEIKINKDGTLPRNQYNNFDICNRIIPEGVVYIDLPYLPRLLKKTDIEFVEAMTGFEKGGSGPPHPKIFGVIAHQKDEQKIRQIFEDNIEEIEQKRKDQLKNGLMQQWKQLFKAILLKKQINEKYAKIND